MDKNRNFFNVNPIQSVKQNSFAGGGSLIEEPKKHQQRLNGYDSNILNDKTLPQGETEKLKMEFKISEKQKELTDINGKIKNAELYGTQNEVLSLRVRKQRLEQELFELNRQNSTKLIKNTKGEVIELPWLKKAQTFVSRNVLARVSKKFNSIVFLGDSLEKLSDINRSVDALIEMNVPYGERKENYEKLTQYLYQANQIHSQITKTMNGMKT
ncbi:hypothetical protein IJZ97_00335 [bacterium]|nr:hypothetical protein [bacterium]